jgi:hypothetical protein
MEFNIKKCKVVLGHLGFNNVEHAYFMEGEQLEVTEKERDVGVNVMRVSNSLRNARRQQGQHR